VLSSRSIVVAIAVVSWPVVARLRNR